MIEFKPLAYRLEELMPYISAQTLSFHHQKHYQGYVTKLNDLISNTDFENLSLENIILKSASDTLWTAIFNNAAQVYNHEFYFNSLAGLDENKKIPAALEKEILKDFQSVDALKEKLIEVGLAVFGSGYVWLVKEDGHLKVEPFLNAFTPLTKPNMVPLLAIDVWEHAYYLDKQNLRAAYLKDVVNNLINWSFVYQNLK